MFVIATPIGNLSDLSPRTKQALQDSELILAEDTRVTIKVLNHLGIRKPLVSCHEFNESKRLSLLEELAGRDASVALVSDAGTPLVSDPGYRMVQKGIALEMKIVPIAGPSAFLLALIGSGLPCDRFCFEGFLPEKSGDRKRKLTELKEESRTMVFYLSPHDQVRLVSELMETFGDRSACIARELTKLYEEFIRGSLSQILERIGVSKLRGECVLVVEGVGQKQAQRAEAGVVLLDLRQRLQNGERLKEISALLAKKYGWGRSEIYKLGIDNLPERL